MRPLDGALTRCVTPPLLQVTLAKSNFLVIIVLKQDQDSHLDMATSLFAALVIYGPRNRRICREQRYQYHTTCQRPQHELS